MPRLGPVSWEAISTVYDAILFLREYLHISTTGTVFGWHISDGEDFEMSFKDNGGLIEHARYERDVLVKLWGEKE